MPGPKKYPDDLCERATRLAIETRPGPGVRGVYYYTL